MKTKINTHERNTVFHSTLPVDLKITWTVCEMQIGGTEKCKSPWPNRLGTKNDNLPVPSARLDSPYSEELY